MSEARPQSHRQIVNCLQFKIRRTKHGKGNHWCWQRRAISSLTRDTRPAIRLYNQARNPQSDLASNMSLVPAPVRRRRRQGVTNRIRQKTGEAATKRASDYAQRRSGSYERRQVHAKNKITRNAKRCRKPPMMVPTSHTNMPAAPARCCR